MGAVLLLGSVWGGQFIHSSPELAAVFRLKAPILAWSVILYGLTASVLPVWLLLAHNADWRWLTDRADSAWYPDVTLYRQDTPGDWLGLLQKVKVDVHAEFNRHLEN